MHAQLIQIRQQLAASLQAIDALLSDNPAPVTVADTSIYRASPGGMLSQEGVDEMYRRFELGETDAVIARAMAVSVQGVQKRRTIWKSSQRRFRPSTP